MPITEMSVERRQELEAKRDVLLEELEGVLTQLNPKTKIVHNAAGAAMLLETDERGRTRIVRLWR